MTAPSLSASAHPQTLFQRTISRFFTRPMTQNAMAHSSTALANDVGAASRPKGNFAAAKVTLYFAPGACSLAAHICLREAQLPFDLAMVDITTHRTADGRDFSDINPKGYVPALQLGSGAPLTENVAILSFISDAAPHLLPEGANGKLRLIEMLAFIATELHKPFIGLMFTENDAMRAHLKQMIGARLAQLDAMSEGHFLFGEHFATADAYFYVMARWARMLDVDMPAGLSRIAERIEQRPAVEAAIKVEGLQS